MRLFYVAACQESIAEENTTNLDNYSRIQLFTNFNCLNA